MALVVVGERPNSDGERNHVPPVQDLLHHQVHFLIDQQGRRDIGLFGCLIGRRFKFHALEPGQ